MGCHLGRPNVNDMHPNMFRVQQLKDESNYAFTSSVLEVKPRELVLHKKGNAPTRWALHALRRYGFDDNMFTFESGRHCSTGNKLFVFRCSRAEILFNVLQDAIQTASRESAATAGSRGLHLTRGPHNHDSGIATLPASGLHRDRQPRRLSEGAAVDHAIATTPNAYMNVELNGGGHLSPGTSPHDGNAYVNTELPAFPAPRPPPPPPLEYAQLQLPASAEDLAGSSTGIEYVQLDLSAPATPRTPRSPPADVPPSSYAQIDFNKTAALENFITLSAQQDRRLASVS